MSTTVECTSDISNASTTIVHLLYDAQLISMPNYSRCLPHCGMCHSFLDDPTYIIFNLILIGVVLPLIAGCGLIGSVLSAFVYSRPPLRTSTNLYLCALGVSDCFVIISSCIFTVDSLRRYSVTMTTWYGRLSPIIYASGMAAQMCSVYLTLAAAVDCFAHICLSTRLRDEFDRRCTLPRTITTVIVFAIVYNIPHYYEAVVLDCWHLEFDAPTLEVCPHPFRYDPHYLLYYYKWGYSIFLAIGPLLLLILLNACIIVATVLRHRRAISTTSVLLRTSSIVASASAMPASGAADISSDDTTALVVVVFLFIVSNTTALLLNIFEETLDKQLGTDINYVVDGSNLLVVTNSSANFLIYYKLSKTFRTTLCQYVCRKRRREPKRPSSNNNVIRMRNGSSSMHSRSAGGDTENNGLLLMCTHRPAPLLMTTANRELLI